MKNILIHPTYFPSVSHYIVMTQANEIYFELEDNFQKQTNRNRAYIYSPNGVQLLNVPVQNDKKQLKQKSKDILIDYSENWQKQHIKSLEAAYRSSPFFEYFEQEISDLLLFKHKYLLDLNIKTFEFINDCMSNPIAYSTTKEYFPEFEKGKDLRHLVQGKKDKTEITPYPQVFDDKHGFIHNLSILDLLFSEGNCALDYLLKEQKSLIL